MGHSRPLFLYFRLFCNLIVQLVDTILPMTRFEPLISGVGSSRSCNWATTTALLPLRLSFSLTHSPSLHLNFSHSKIFKRGSIFILCRSQQTIKSSGQLRTKTMYCKKDIPGLQVLTKAFSLKMLSLPKICFFLSHFTHLASRGSI